MRFLFFCWFILFSSLADEGTVGNGGDGYKVSDNLVYLFDFVESGIEESARIPEIEPNDEIKTRIEAVFNHTDSTYNITVNTDALSKVITHFYNMDILFGTSLVMAIELFDWQFINLSLLDIHDADTVVDIDPTREIQLAVRAGHQIKIDKNNFRKLPEVHRTGLLIHEILYALIRPKKRLYAYWKQDSTKVREITAKMFSSRGQSLDNITFFQNSFSDDERVDGHNSDWFSIASRIPINNELPYYYLQEEKSLEVLVNNRTSIPTLDRGTPEFLTSARGYFYYARKNRSYGVYGRRNLTLGPVPWVSSVGSFEYSLLCFNKNSSRGLLDGTYGEAFWGQEGIYDAPAYWPGGEMRIGWGVSKLKAELIPFTTMRGTSHYVAMNKGAGFLQTSFSFNWSDISDIDFETAREMARNDEDMDHDINSCRRIINANYTNILRENRLRSIYRDGLMTQY